MFFIILKLFVCEHHDVHWPKQPLSFDQWSEIMAVLVGEWVRLLSKYWHRLCRCCCCAWQTVLFNHCCFWEWGKLTICTFLISSFLQKKYIFCFCRQPGWRRHCQICRSPLFPLPSENSTLTVVHGVCNIALHWLYKSVSSSCVGNSALTALHMIVTNSVHVTALNAVLCSSSCVWKL